MTHIDQIRLASHPDPRMRAAAAEASRLRSDMWRTVLGRAMRGCGIALGWLWNATIIRVARPVWSRTIGAHISLSARTGACQ
ncbi:MAG: hypothetical protein RID11_19260 [Roseovarius sp.]|jgi:hypothetical protein|uniref:hypothetical protein n=1 Tax=Roseovarius sp. TaxID=1486281 RepID=UPI0032ED0463